MTSENGDEASNGKLYTTDRKQFVKILPLLYNHRLFCDVVLVAEGSEVPANKVILAACSPFFYEKFSENEDFGSDGRIEINDISHEILSSVVEYLYTSEILITEDNVGELLAASCMLSLQDLQGACARILPSHLRPDNCLRYLSIARQYQLKELVSQIGSYINDNHKDVTGTDQFLRLTYEEVVELLNCGAFGWLERAACFLMWSQHDIETRGQRQLD